MCLIENRGKQKHTTGISKTSRNYQQTYLAFASDLGFACKHVNAKHHNFAHSEIFSLQDPDGECRKKYNLRGLVSL